MEPVTRVRERGAGGRGGGYLSVEEKKRAGEEKQEGGKDAKKAKERKYGGEKKQGKRREVAEERQEAINWRNKENTAEY